MAQTAVAGPGIERQGSRLSVTWESATPGTWELTDTAGNVCARGAVEAGDNRIDLPKVSAPTPLRLSLKSANAEPQVFTVPADRRLSPLPKVAQAGVIYQVPPRTYLAEGAGRGESGQLADLTTARLTEIKDLGADYLWLTGVIEQASRTQNDPDIIKGDAGSYYAIYDNWDVSSQIGSLGDFEGLIERAHGVGLRVIVDFVANHTARVHRTDIACKQHMDFGRSDRTERFFDRDNNYFYVGGTTFTPPPQGGASGADGVFDTDVFAPGVQLETPARVTGNDIVTASPQIYDWFETVKLNYGWDFVARRAQYEPRPRTWDQMLDVARYWVEKGVDGFRVDFAHAVPIEFWRYFATELKRVQPNVFLLAEAYESDQRMKVPGFSYHALLAAGFDSVYDSEMYWAMHNQAQRPGDMRSAIPSRSPSLQPNVVERGFLFTHYMENHDEVRVASRHFAPWIGERQQRAALGLAYTAYLGLMPGHMMLHGGQELQEDASAYGGYAGDNGRTSIFDFVYQSQTRLWHFGQRPDWMVDFRERYKALLTLKRQPAFAAVHKASAPSIVDLDGANGGKEQAKWISSYLRFAAGEVYLVVANADPFVAHTTTVHFTGRDGADTLGALAAARIENSDRRYVFTEVYGRPGWVPSDPAVPGGGMPGWALYRAGNVPSGLHLGDVPPATTYVFKLTNREVSP